MLIPSNKSNLRIEKRTKALLLNDCIKIITQASWDLKILSEQYPVQKIGEDEYDEYISFVEEQVQSFAEAIGKMANIIRQ